MISHDLHVVVAIGSGVLVPEADNVSKFVHDDAEFVAVFANGYRLWTVAAFSHKRTASARFENEKKKSVKKSTCFCFDK